MGAGRASPSSKVSYKASVVMPPSRCSVTIIGLSIENREPETAGDRHQ
jgi:hypothetical protein